MEEEKKEVPKKKEEEEKAPAKEKKPKEEPKKESKKKEEREASPKQNSQPVEPQVTKPKRPESSMKRPPVVKDNVDEINDNVKGDKTKGIITDAPSKEDAEEKVLTKEIKQEEEVQGNEKKIKFTSKLRPGASTGGEEKKKAAVVNITDLESIKAYIQEISRNANPIGKILDFIQDDIDSMNKELQMWIKEQKSLKDKYDEEVKYTFVIKEV